MLEPYGYLKERDISQNVFSLKKIELRAKTSEQAVLLVRLHFFNFSSLPLNVIRSTLNA
jgi:hypothetical protein